MCSQNSTLKNICCATAVRHLLQRNTSCRTVKPTRAWERKPGLLTDTAVREGQDPWPCGEPPSIELMRSSCPSERWRKNRNWSDKNSTHCWLSDESPHIFVTSLTLTAVWWKSAHFCDQSDIVSCLMKVLTCDQSNTVCCLMKVLTLWPV